MNQESKPKISAMQRTETAWDEKKYMDILKLKKILNKDVTSLLNKYMPIVLIGQEINQWRPYGISSIHT